MRGAVEHLRNLVRIPSVSNLSNRPVIEYAEAALQELRWRTQRHEYKDAAGIEKINLIAAPAGEDVNATAAELAFVCHTDTVPYSPKWAKATDPDVKDGLLLGCGACDVKGFLACVLAAVSQVPTKDLARALRVVLTADEEVGCIGAARLIESGAIRPKRIVIGEPTSLHPARAGKGYCLANVTVFGREAHSALPHKGKSAIYGASRLIAEIEKLGEKLREHRHEFFSPAFTTLNVGTICGGTAKNVIAGECTFQLEWRPIPGEPADAVPAAVAAIAERLRQDDPEFLWKLETVRQQAGFETSADSSLVRSIEALTGRGTASIPFASEASLFATMAEEVVVFGPGDMQTAHSDRECVPVSELEEALVVLKSLMTAQ